jgi:hypothetical protein
MKTIFELGDKVFDHKFGWGKVKEINSSSLFCVVVDFINFEKIYLENGSLFLEQNPSLSFTEYTLKGFSQERPESLPERGDVVWVRNFEIDPWEVAHFIEKQDHFYLVNPNNPYNESGVCYRFLTTVNPYKKEQDGKV